MYIYGDTQMKLSNETKLLVSEYAYENYSDYSGYLEDYYLIHYGYQPDSNDHGSIWTMLWFYESKHPMEDI